MNRLHTAVHRAQASKGRAGSRRKGRLGFALLEALVAMAIASIALATLYRSVGQGSKNVGDVEARVEATLLARSVLAGATYAEDLAQTASGQSGAWHWVVHTAPEQVQIAEEGGRPVTSPISAARVTIDISRAKGGAPVVSWTTWKPWRTAP
ncbi:type IV pilus modification PilV family protein [Simplicispira suum]|uniref:General secretion pathway protein GspI n=1 Tax=Simplicispira suum TaxID=2109915 RepID=A0A2S0MXW8_9BURK|nr:prepilin-type N-terminal cleavage/methylation domain-containing protein [Simplicispira suum]AVO40732.1 general secretion pathway protein GspI [Simplicispira suum]MBW7831902.1 prepilin-type N-terminal cleavage/methylation domain-containing protein [Simplicispira suum]